MRRFYLDSKRVSNALAKAELDWRPAYPSWREGLEALLDAPPPRIEIPLASYGESLLGFAYPPAPTAATVLLGFRLDALFLIGSLVAAGLYIAGVIALRHRNDARFGGYSRRPAAPDDESGCSPACQHQR